MCNIGDDVPDCCSLMLLAVMRSSLREYRGGCWATRGHSSYIHRLSAALFPNDLVTLQSSIVTEGLETLFNYHQRLPYTVPAAVTLSPSSELILLGIISPDLCPLLTPHGLCTVSKLAYACLRYADQVSNPQVSHQRRKGFKCRR